MKYIIDNNNLDTELPTIPEVSVEFDESFLLWKLKKGQLMDNIHKEMKFLKDIDKKINNNGISAFIRDHKSISDNAKQQILSILKNEISNYNYNDINIIINELNNILNDNEKFDSDKIKFNNINNKFNNFLSKKGIQ
jgi:hypothetical protein